MIRTDEPTIALHSYRFLASPHLQLYQLNSDNTTMSRGKNKTSKEDPYTPITSSTNKTTIQKLSGIENQQQEVKESLELFAKHTVDEVLNVPICDYHLVLLTHLEMTNVILKNCPSFTPAVAHLAARKLVGSEYYWRRVKETGVLRF